MDRRFHNILQRRHMREEIEPLENHTEFGSLCRDLLVVQGLEYFLALMLDFLEANHLAVHADFAAGQGLQLVDQPQEGRLARAGRTENHSHGARHDGHVDAFEHVEVPKSLVHTDCLDRRRGVLRRRLVVLL